MKSLLSIIAVVILLASCATKKERTYSADSMLFGHEEFKSSELFNKGDIVWISSDIGGSKVGRAYEDRSIRVGHQSVITNVK